MAKGDSSGGNAFGNLARGAAGAVGAAGAWKGMPQALSQTNPRPAGAAPPSPNPPGNFNVGGLGPGGDMLQKLIQMITSQNQGGGMKYPGSFTTPTPLPGQVGIQANTQWNPQPQVMPRHEVFGQGMPAPFSPGWFDFLKQNQQKQGFPGGIINM